MNSAHLKPPPISNLHFLGVRSIHNALALRDFRKSYAFYSRGAWTIYGKTNIFHLDNGGATDSTIIVSSDRTKRPHAITTREVMTFVGEW